MSQASTEPESVETLEALNGSEALIRAAEELHDRTTRLIESTGIPKGAGRKIINHPLASKKLKEEGLAILQRWKDEVDEILKQKKPSLVMRRRRSSRKVMSI